MGRDPLTTRQPQSVQQVEAGTVHVTVTSSEASGQTNQGQAQQEQQAAETAALITKLPVPADHSYAGVLPVPLYNRSSSAVAVDHSGSSLRSYASKPQPASLAAQGTSETGPLSHGQSGTVIA